MEASPSHVRAAASQRGGVRSRSGGWSGFLHTKVEGGGGPRISGGDGYSANAQARMEKSQEEQC